MGQNILFQCTPLLPVSINQCQQHTWLEQTFGVHFYWWSRVTNCKTNFFKYLHTSLTYHSSQLTTHEIELQHNVFLTFLYFIFFTFLKEINLIKTCLCLLDPFHTFFVEKKKNNVTRKLWDKTFCFNATPLLPVSINQCQQHTWLEQTFGVRFYL